MRAGFGFFRRKLPIAQDVERRGRGQAVASRLLAVLLALACVAGTSTAQTPAPSQSGKARAPAKAQAPAKPRPPAKPRAPAKTHAPDKGAAPITPAPPAAPAPQPEPAATPASPPGRAAVDVDVDKLQPYNLPPASREKMRQCGDEWRKLKMDGHSAGLTWRIFAEKCLPR
jgi:hypothetical protein